MFTKKRMAICSLLLCSSMVFAEDATPIYKNDETGVKVDANVTQGFRLDKLKFSISGPNHKPNIISELTYKNIKIYQTRLRTQITKDDYFAKLMLGYGLVCGGKVQDSDYAGNNRHKEFSRSHHHVPGDFTLDAQIAFGKNFQVTPNTTLSPFVGYNVSMQKLRMKGGHSASNRRLRYHKLNSTHRSIWDSPLIGARATLQATNKLDLFAEYDFLFAAQYHGKGHWNMRSLDFKDHSSRKHGFGHMGTIGVNYALFANCSLGAEYQLSCMHAKGGEVKFRQGRHSARQPFHKASLLSSEVRLAFNYAF